MCTAYPKSGDRPPAAGRANIQELKSYPDAIVHKKVVKLPEILQDLSSGADNRINGLCLRPANKLKNTQTKATLMKNVQSAARQYLDELALVLKGFNLEQFEKIVSLILEAYEKDQKIFVMGNGGSGSTASHFACDINKGCCMDLEKKFKMICLNDNIPTMLALANDVSYDVVFEEQLKNFFSPGDLVIGISGSGNSENVLRAIRYANANGGRTAGMAGFAGGKLARLAQAAFVAEVDDMQKVEDLHIIVVHMLMQTIHGALHQN